MTATTADRKVTREERLEGLQADLAAGVEALSDSDEFRRFLDTAARFHHYSANNVLLIQIQRPDATRVAGFRVWQKLGRQVRKGEHGIWILAPVTYRAHEDGDAPDENSGPYVVRGFRPVPVFDVSQTDGDPLPDLTPETLTGEASTAIWDAAAAAVESRGFTVEVSDSRDAHGFTNFRSRQVVIGEANTPAERVAVLIHEFAHVLLHDPEAGTFPGHEGIGEVEAESAAYVALAALGIDRVGSLKYVAGWASTAPADVLHSTAQRVVKTAHVMLTAIDPEESE